LAGGDVIGVFADDNYNVANDNYFGRWGRSLSIV